MEFMDGGCLTDILEEFDYVQMTAGQIALVCRESLQGMQRLFLFCIVNATTLLSAIMLLVLYCLGWFGFNLC
jgi:hypothetical protein